VKLAKYLAGLGYGTRREVERMIRDERISLDAADAPHDARAGYAAVGPAVADAVAAMDDAAAHRLLRVDGMPLDPPPGAVIMLHKPVGYVCSTDDVNPTVYDLVPDRFRLRRPVMSPVGRLDKDTSGLLLMTDDGQLNHRITSPRTHVAKTYEATLAADISADDAPGLIARFASGELVLAGETAPLKPAVLEIVEPRAVRVTITEGRYHQVRRMFAAVGNHVVTLHRSAVATLSLGGLPPAAWRELDEDEIRALR
jgi:16S rRNA pseudouridine516 synthase